MPPPAPPRDLMAPDTDPTDEELHAVMLAARDAAMERKKLADLWTAARIAEVTAAVATDRAAGSSVSRRADD